jgi:hypothetical protein
VSDASKRISDDIASIKRVSQSSISKRSSLDHNRISTSPKYHNFGKISEKSENSPSVKKNYVSETPDEAQVAIGHLIENK